MITYANQKIIHIQKSQYEKNYLQIGNDEWQKAGKILTYAAFKLYLYLAGNKDGFDLVLSQKAVEHAIGISKATYHTAVQELESRGYISCKQGNVYEFTPNTAITEEDAEKIKQEETHLKRVKRYCRQDSLKSLNQENENEIVLSTIQDCLADDTNMSVQLDEVVLSTSIEINKQIINNIDNDFSDETNVSSEDKNQDFNQRASHNIEDDDEDTFYSKSEADRLVHRWCIKNSCDDIVDEVKEDIGNNMDGLFGLSISKPRLVHIMQNKYNSYYEI